MAIAGFFSRNAFPIIILAGIGIFVSSFSGAGGVGSIRTLGRSTAELVGLIPRGLESIGRFVSGQDLELGDPNVISAEPGGDQSIADAVQAKIDAGGLAEGLPDVPLLDLFPKLPSAEAIDELEPSQIGVFVPRGSTGPNIVETVRQLRLQGESIGQITFEPAPDAFTSPEFFGSEYEDLN